MAADRVAHALRRGFPRQRVLRLCREAIARHRLDLSGLVVLTEAATGYYRVTPVLAALAGADTVLAVARDSSFGTSRQAAMQVIDLARGAGVSPRIEVTATGAQEVASRAEVVTNLGAVRPIDAKLARALRAPGAAVSLMFGARDARPADIDVRALRKLGIPVAAVDEDAIGLFRWTGQRVAWWLAELGVEVAGARVVIWGGSSPAQHAAKWLRGAGARVKRVDRLPRVEHLHRLDALVLMAPGARIDSRARLTPARLARVAPGAAVLEYSGRADRRACQQAGLMVYPPAAPRKGHVGKTIGELLYAPVIELHAAGLRVGEILSRARSEGLSRAQCERRALEHGPGERLPLGPARRRRNR